MKSLSLLMLATLASGVRGNTIKTCESADCSGTCGGTATYSNKCSVDSKFGPEGTELICDATGKTMTLKSYAKAGCDGDPVQTTHLTSGVCKKMTDSSSYLATCDTSCFARDTSATLSDGSSILMTDLTAGDYVLDGNSMTRVIVNQHSKNPSLTSALLNIEHAEGSLSLTPDHVLSIDGNFAPARDAAVGSQLGDFEVSKVSGSVGGIINPLTVSGKIIANGVLASTYPEWIASYMLASSVLPTFTLTNLVSFLFPAMTQEYYDAVLERFFQSNTAHLLHIKESLPAPVFTLLVIMADLAAVSGFVLYSIASTRSIFALLAIAAYLKSQRK